MVEPDMGKEKNKPYIAVVIPNKIDGKKFKPIPIDYISGDNKEKICIINDILKIDSTGLSNKEVINDFINKVHFNWKNFRAQDGEKLSVY
jgi:hypothetical protein